MSAEGLQTSITREYGFCTSRVRGPKAFEFGQILKARLRR